MVSGKVTDQLGRPLSGWELRFDGRTRAVTATDSSGGYALRLLDGPYNVTVSTDFDFRFRPVGTIHVSAKHAYFTFSFEAHLVTGHVLSPTGSVLDSGYVSVGGVDDQGNDFYANSSFGSGAFSLSLPSGKYNFYGSARNLLSGYPGALVSNVTVVGDTTFDIELAGNLVSGVVRGPDGLPLGGVRVSASGESNGATAITNDAGAYSLYVPSGSYRFFLTPAANIFPRITNLYSLNGSAHFDFDLTSTRWSGTLRRTGSGDPIPGVLVAAWLFGDRYQRAASATTDASGSFDLYLEPGLEYSLNASEGNLTTHVSPGIIANVDTTFNITLDPAPIP
jgi:hypothetical protein